MTIDRGLTVAWRKSARSTPKDDCVELAAVRGAGVLVRDSKLPDGAVCAFGAGEFADFLRRVKRGDHDL
jgi:hypothetical protein